MAVGLLNVSAIAIISERYKGKNVSKHFGIRGSAEVVGTAVLTFGVSLLIRFAGRLPFSRLWNQYSYLALCIFYLSPYGSENSGCRGETSE